MTPFVCDPDFTLYVGDVRDVLRDLPDESVHCVVTSPPYWALRDYGTASWIGGDQHCDHAAPAAGGRRIGGAAFRATESEDRHRAQYCETCEKCGATRVDRQIGLEATPEEFVEQMVSVFREARRVLHPEGTLWLNLGDSYSSNPKGETGDAASTLTPSGTRVQRERHLTAGRVPGLKTKDMVGIPWRVAFALQADGWFLRSDIVWSKPNPMPESVTDRPTKAHEYVFLLAKSERYFFDQEAVREPVTGNAHARGNGLNPKARANADRSAGIKQNASMSAAINKLVTSRNIRSVWEITTQSYAEAHFATFPPELARRCIAAGTPTEVCMVCGKPRQRIIEKGEPELQADTWSARGAAHFDAELGEYVDAETSSTLKHVVPRETVGWTDCGHGSFTPGVVLDPFMGSGTTAFVARQLGRHAVGIELNPEYAELIARRTQQLSILADSEAAA